MLLSGLCILFQYIHTSKMVSVWGSFTLINTAQHVKVGKQCINMNMGVLISLGEILSFWPLWCDRTIVSTWPDPDSDPEPDSEPEAEPNQASDPNPEPEPLNHSSITCKQKLCQQHNCFSLQIPVVLREQRGNKGPLGNVKQVLSI